MAPTTVFLVFAAASTVFASPTIPFAVEQQPPQAAEQYPPWAEEMLHAEKQQNAVEQFPSYAEEQYPPYAENQQLPPYAAEQYPPWAEEMQRRRTPFAKAQHWAVLAEALKQYAEMQSICHTIPVPTMLYGTVNIQTCQSTASACGSVSAVMAPLVNTKVEICKNG